MDSGISREEAYRIIRRSTGDALPKQGDSLVMGRKGGFEFLPFALAPVKNVGSNYDVEGKDVVLLCSGTIDISLPPAEYAEFRVLFIKNVSTGTITIVPDGSDTIDGGSSAIMTDQWDSLIIVSDGANWFSF